MSRTITVKLEDRILAQIDAEARVRRTTRSAVVRERLARTGRAGGSAWNRMKDLVLGEDSAPADLASNKAHLRGYGSARRR